MAHFAKLGKGNIVEEVAVVSNDIAISEEAGISFLQQLYKSNDTWIQTSYNANFRKNYAGVGFQYDTTRDAFIPPQPFQSWTLDEDTCTWVPPTSRPDDNNYYNWDEVSRSWIQI
jgi:hypothetical protein